MGPLLWLGKYCSQLSSFVCCDYVFLLQRHGVYYSVDECPVSVLASFLYIRANPSQSRLMDCKMHLSSGTCMTVVGWLVFLKTLPLESSALLFHSVLLGLWTHGPVLYLGFPHHHPWPPAALDACVLDTQRPPPGLLPPFRGHISSSALRTVQ